jgi:SNF2 family DNA or RNA helicase
MVFLWDRKALDANRKLHKDYLENCRPLLANGELVPLSKEEAWPYMNIVWNLMVKDECYNNWLSNKRSNSYQAVQNSFMSE